MVIFDAICWVPYFLRPSNLAHSSNIMSGWGAAFNSGGKAFVGIRVAGNCLKKHNSKFKWPLLLSICSLRLATRMIFHGCKKVIYKDPCALL